MTAEWTCEVSEAGLGRLAELLALKLRIGDIIALRGDLGAGKTTFARALIGAFHLDGVEVPSPTFSLQQTYDTPRLRLTHFDFYRLTHADEARELGLAEAIATGAVVIEWPERAWELMPASRFEIALAETANPDVRSLTLRGYGPATAAVHRLRDIMTFLDAQTEWRSASIRHLQGDASSRSYARLFGEGKTVLLMDAPRQPDGPPIRNGKPYSQIAHLAEDIRAFSAIAAALRGAELSAPAILAEDLDKGLMLLEDLGQRIFSVEAERDPSAQAQLWTAAVDALLALHLRPAPERLPLRNGRAHVLPAYDRGALTIEVELLLDWYWPAVHGAQVADDARAAFLAAWDPVIDRLLRMPRAWVLRDFHSPNLIWMPEREGIRRVGVIDFQDAQRGPAAYDLVSLLQDARVDVPEALEAELLQRYCDSAMNADARFDAPEFQFAYAALGAQRSTKILGIFVRLARRDGKPQYLAHLPRLWGYLQRNLAKPELAPLTAWYDRYLPPAVRTGRLPALNAAG